MDSFLMRQMAAGLLAAGIVSALPAAEAENFYPEAIDPRMGDYRGERHLVDGSVEPIFGQVVYRGEDRYYARLIRSLSEPLEPDVRFTGRREGKAVIFEPEMGSGGDQVLQVTASGLLVAASLWEGEIDAAGKRFRGEFAGYSQGTFEMTSMGLQRYQSPTMGDEPPEGAVVLLDRGSLDQWSKAGGGKPSWKRVKGGAIEVAGEANIVSKPQFGDHRLHLEFRTPYMPNHTGQARGNSGVYLLGRYEVQILDSYGLEGEWNECGGIYQVARPQLNMCAPPTVWQTYDIDFRAPRFENGNKVENARITVHHNGVLIHDNVELPGATGGSLARTEAPEGPLVLQEHSDPVQYRNIWVQEL